MKKNEISRMKLQLYLGNEIQLNAHKIEIMWLFTSDIVNNSRNALSKTEIKYNPIINSQK